VPVALCVFVAEHAAHGIESGGGARGGQFEFGELRKGGRVMI
jgi:hypothetical protein